MKSITALLLVALSTGPVLGESIAPARFTASGHVTDTLGTVKQRVQKKAAVLLDVREKAEWDDGHLQQAHLVPLSVIKAGRLTATMKKQLPKDKPVYVHCASGGRVLIVSELLRPQGYDIRPLRAGYGQLLKAGFRKAMQK